MPTQDIIPNDEQQTNNIFCYDALAEKQEGTLYTDTTGALQEISLNGTQYFFVAYDYVTNYIFALPIANVQDKKSSKHSILSACLSDTPILGSGHILLYPFCWIYPGSAKNV